MCHEKKNFFFIFEKSLFFKCDFSRLRYSLIELLAHISLTVHWCGCSSTRRSRRVSSGEYEVSVCDKGEKTGDSTV